ncbi:MAG: DNA methylase N-4 [Chlorobi bacterium]|nr:DNA methylase N-4 [Chlorobiota bacterium]
MDENKYWEFVRSKQCVAATGGFDIDPAEVNPILKLHQRDMAVWAVRGGRRAIFAAFGLGKTMMQLEIVRLTLKHAGGNGLIVCPLGVRQEFKRDAAMLGIPIKFIRTLSEIEDGITMYLTNYETVRDGKIDPRHFTVASLDEASVLRGFGGTKTFREFMRLFAGDGKSLNDRVRSDAVPYRYVATATPSPNDYIELLAYSAYLDIMDVSGAKTRYFKRDSTKADNLTLLPHKEEEFWLWVASWALFVDRPSDLGYDDAGYSLPEMQICWHEVRIDSEEGGGETRHDHQRRIFRDASLGIVEASREKRDSIEMRIGEMLKILDEDRDSHYLLWHDLERERHAIKSAVPDAVCIYGSQDLEQREEAIIDFSDGKIKYLAAKPIIAGSGCNFQRHCHKAIFLGIGFKFNDFIQALHRIQRFLQTKTVEVHLIYTEGERNIRKQLEKKWEKHNKLRSNMSRIIQEHGLSEAALASKMVRAVGVQRVEVKGERYRIVNNDTVVETARMEENSVGLILSSIPFSTQYEYSPNYADFGHSDNNAHFFQQMDFLIPELLRVLQPGRICAIHVKDRIVPMGMTGAGSPTVYPFHMETTRRFMAHGFEYMGKKTIITDVVRENNQTYRLGWTRQCDDATCMGVGMPEELLLFRKRPTDTSNSYADEPVVKSKERYSRARWQVDAHSFTRSSGDRLLRPDELRDMDHHQIFKAFRRTNLEEIYNFEHHVRLGEELDEQGRLPVTFMLLQPPSWHPDVWTDITRMLTLNTDQSVANRELHLCPMQFDLADRVIAQFSNIGDVVFDPFGGLMTVPYRAVLLGRYGVGHELSPAYFTDGATYCRSAEYSVNLPTLFDAIEAEEACDESSSPVTSQEGVY